jgi:hypothetical protein
VNPCGRSPKNIAAALIGAGASTHLRAAGAARYASAVWTHATTKCKAFRLSGALHRSVALAAATPAGIDDPSNVAPGRTPSVAHQCSQIRDQPLHRRVLYLVSVLHANNIPHLRYCL